MENNSEQEMEDNNNDADDSQEIATYRNMLIEIEQRVAEQFDKTILTIAGGSLAISLAFIKDVIGNGPMQHGLLLIISWACLTACLVSILISFYFGLLAYRKAQDQVDDETIKNETPGGFYAKVVSTCNGLGIILLCAGLITLFTFAYNNLSKEILNGTKTCPSTSSQTNAKTKTKPAASAETTTGGTIKTTNGGLPCAATKTSKVEGKQSP